MRKVTNRFAAVIMVLLMICSIPVSAISESTNRASEQIMSYYINVVPAGNGKIAIAFSIDGTGEMKNIGAESTNRNLLRIFLLLSALNRCYINGFTDS